MPTAKQSNRSYAQLNIHEREFIAQRRAAGDTQKEIAKQLKRDPSTISREINRHKNTNGDYSPNHAQTQADNKRKHSKQFCRWRQNVDLALRVYNDLYKGWTPEIICGRLKKEFPDKPQWHVSHTAVYNEIHRDKTDGGELYKCCPFLKKNRKRKRNTRAAPMPGRTSIHLRNEEANNRTTFGHWEGDLIIGAKQSGCLLTIIDRKTRYLIARKIETKHAETVIQAFRSAFRNVDKRLVASITLDNGTEFARFEQLEMLFNAATFFCDPYASWQKGSVENINGRLRRFFPKQMTFENLSPEKLAAAVRKINHTPKKCLDFNRPEEMFLQESQLLAR